MKNKKFNLGLLIIIPLIFFGYFLSVYFLYFDNKDDSFSIETYFDYKEGYANSIKTNKILFASGSNNFLGIRAYQVADSFNVPAVNMAIHAGLQTPYILERLKGAAKKGDIIIVPLEYHNYTNNGEPSITLNKYLLTYDTSYFDANFDLTGKLKILSSISIQDLLNSIFYGERNFAVKNEYRKELLQNLNANGDMLNITEHDSLKTKKPTFSLPEPFDTETKSLKAIKEFNNYCIDHKIAFFVTFPNLIYDEAYEKQKYQNYFRYLLAYFKKNNINVLGTPKQAMYPQNLFFDSEYHLISKGSDIRTKEFIEVMRADKVMLNAIKMMNKQDIKLP